MGKIRPKDLENGVAVPWANYYYGTNGHWEVWFHQVPWASESSWEAEYVFWENISAWKLVFFGDGTFKEKYQKWFNVYDTNNRRATNSFWYDAGHQKYRIKFDMPSETKYLSSIMLPITKSWTGHDGNYKVYARILTLWETLIKETNQALGNQFINGVLKLDFWNVKLDDDSYWLELDCTTVNTTNYFNIGISSNEDYAAWADTVKYGYYRYDGSTWLQESNKKSIVLRLNFSIPTENGKVYECNSSMLDTCIPNWVTLETKTQGQVWKVMIAWVTTWMSWLYTWLTYKLNSKIGIWWARRSRADRRINYSAAENKVADIFTCDFTQAISKLWLYVHCNNNTISNSLVAKIVTLDDTTWMPSETLADENAIASIPYANLINNVWQPVIFKFPWEFTLTPNKKYALVLECDGTLSTAWYITVRYDNSTWDGSMYLLNNNVWTFQNVAYSLCYSFLYWDWVDEFQVQNWMRDPSNANNRRFTFVWEANTVVSANRFMVSVPTKVKSLTFMTEESWVPVTDLWIRIETNRLLTAAANTNWAKYDGTGGSDYRKDFGSTVDKKLWMKFAPSEDVVVKYLTLTLRKISSPSDKVTVRIETDDNGKPSGTLVSELATATSDQSLQTTQNADYTSRFKFGWNISLSKNTSYWIVLSKENEATSATSYYQVYCKNGWTFTAWSLYTTTDWTTWSAVETGNVKMRFYFNNSNNNSMDVPSGELVADWAFATLPAASYISWQNFHTVVFDHEITLIPNTIYWLVFENFRPVVDWVYWRVFSCTDSDRYMWNRPMTMPFLNIALNEYQQWTPNDQRRYPRFRFDGERYDNGWELDLTQWDFAGKFFTAVTPTAWVLSTWEAGNVAKISLASNANTRGSQFVFRAPKDWKITFLKALNWSVRSYTYWWNYTPLATITQEAATSVNIEKGVLYQVSNNTTSVQDFILSFN